MINWLINNIGTIVFALILATIVIGISVKLVKDSKQGKTSCGCSCAHCAMSGQCRKYSSSVKNRTGFGSGKVES